MEQVSLYQAGLFFKLLIVDRPSLNLMKKVLETLVKDTGGSPKLEPIQKVARYLRTILTPKSLGRILAE